MKIILAKSAGYCFGVRDAVNAAYDISKEHGEVYMLGDIVHNESVVEDLEKKGVKVVEKLEQIPKDKPVMNLSKIPILSIYGAGLASAKIYSALTTPAVLPYLL